MWVKVTEHEEMQAGATYRVRYGMRGGMPGSVLQASLRLAIKAIDAVHRGIVIQKVDFVPVNTDYAMGRYTPWELRVEWKKVGGGTPILLIVGLITAAIAFFAIANRSVEKLVDAGTDFTKQLTAPLRDPGLIAAGLAVAILLFGRK